MEAIGRQKKLLSIAIDFGTMYTGSAFSFYGTYKADPTQIYTMKHDNDSSSFKVPTCILIGPDITCKAFGKSAIDRYFDLKTEERDGHYLFKEFKMALYNEEEVTGDMLLTDIDEKTLPAIKVFSLAIQFLKDDVLKRCNEAIVDDKIVESDATWVLTVPTIWSDKSKAFMRQAAVKAGIPSSCLLIALEPEVASIYCQHLSVNKDRRNSHEIATFQRKTKYIVIDAGGGTIDFTAHEQVEKADEEHGVQLKEIHKSCGNGNGGKNVNDEFLNFLKVTFGKDVVNDFERRYPEAFNDTMQEFEMKKRVVTKDDRTFKVSTNIVESLNDKAFESENVSYKSGKLQIKHADVKKMFKGPIDSIIETLKKMLETEMLKDCRVVLMVGGFSNCTLMKDELKEQCPHVTFVLPLDADLVVLKGAVIYGHDSSVIVERVSRLTYGFEMLRHFVKPLEHVFETMVQAGQKIVVGQALKTTTCHPVTEDQTKCSINIYATEKQDAFLVFEDGCKKIGSGILKMEDITGGTDRDITVRMYFGETEFRVEAVDETTGYKTEIPIRYFDTLEEYDPV